MKRRENLITKSLTKNERCLFRFHKAIFRPSVFHSIRYFPFAAKLDANLSITRGRISRIRRIFSEVSLSLFTCFSRYGWYLIDIWWYFRYLIARYFSLIIYSEVSEEQSATPRGVSCMVDNLSPSFKGSKRDTWIYLGRCKVWGVSHKMTGSAGKTSHTWYILINTNLKYSAVRFANIWDAEENFEDYGDAILFSPPPCTFTQSASRNAPFSRRARKFFSSNKYLAPLLFHPFHPSKSFPSFVSALKHAELSRAED